MGEHMKEHLKAQGREPTHYVETAGKMLTSHSRRYFWEEIQQMRL
jgi:hypothetical protein